MKQKQPAPETTDPQFAEQLFSLPVADISPVQQTAMTLWQLGLNVFPLPYGKKGGYPWAMLQYTCLNAEDIYPLFRDNCNLAVMTGRTSGNLFVIDCETEATFKYHERLLKKAGIPLWSVRSMGARNGGHFYLRCADGEVQNIKSGERKDVEIRGNRLYVLAPPSLHPTTRRLYQWYVREIPDPPVISLEQVHWLGLTVAHISRDERMPKPYSQLASSTRDFLTNGATEGERNNRLFSAACDLAGNDYNINAAMQLLLPITRQIATPEREARATIASAYSKPRTPAKPATEQKKKAASWERAMAWAEAQTWKGKSGQTDRVVFLACCERAKTANEYGTFRAASREIAEIARVTRTTAAASLKRLQTASLLVFMGRDRDSKGHLYRLGITTTRTNLVRIRDTATFPNGVVSVTVSNHVLQTDASEALGKTADRLYRHMLTLLPLPRHRDLVLVSGLSKTQVTNALKKLVSYGLVRKNGRAYQVIPCTDEQLDDQVARRAGTFGKGERRKVKHQHERSMRAAERLYKARFGKGYSRSPQAQPGSQGYICTNCGQIWNMPGLQPPLTCDYCGDATTWRLVAVPS